MGIWAVGSFESDAALDWLTRLQETGDFSMVRAALTGDFEQAEPYVAATAVAAADLVACWLGHVPPEPSRKGLVQWTQQHSEMVTPELLGLARRAVRTIKNRSRLRDAWECNGSVVTEWLGSISDLESGLQS